MPTPNWKTLRDRLRWIIGKRRSFVMWFVQESGVEHDDDALELMLDTMIRDINVKKEEDEKKQGIKTAHSEALKKAGEDTGTMATRGCANPATAMATTPRV